MLNPRMRRSGGEGCLSSSPKRFMPRFAKMKRDLDAFLCGKKNLSAAWMIAGKLIDSGAAARAAIALADLSPRNLPREGL